MILETNRLKLIPLTSTQLNLYINKIHTLENELNCINKSEPLVGEWLEIMKKQLQVVQTYPNEYIWLSFWLIIRKNDNVAIGTCSFKNIPNEKQEVEIGYGLHESFWNNGYATEAANCMAKWALQQPNVAHVIAETEPNNTASQKVLQKCGFKEYYHNKNIWWIL